MTSEASIETHGRRHQPGKRPPGPKGLPFLGNLLDFSRDVLRYYLEWAQQYGDIVALRLGTWPAVLLSRSDYAEYVLVEHHRNFRSGSWTITDRRGRCPRTSLLRSPPAKC
jgi:hypothetical protein